MNRILLISSLVVFCAFAKAQPVLVTDVTGDENIFHAQTKQMNQFFRRFNCEEDISGNAYPKTDPQYRNSILRKVFLAGLFDNETSKVSQELKQEFIVTNRADPFKE